MYTYILLGFVVGYIISYFIYYYKNKSSAFFGKAVLSLFNVFVITKPSKKIKIKKMAYIGDKIYIANGIIADKEYTNVNKIERYIVKMVVEINDTEKFIETTINSKKLYTDVSKNDIVFLTFLYDKQLDVIKVLSIGYYMDRIGD